MEDADRERLLGIGHRASRHVKSVRLHRSTLRGRAAELALQSTLLERGAGASEGNVRYVMSWEDSAICPHHPDGCPPER